MHWCGGLLARANVLLKAARLSALKFSFFGL
jgi:hypothetical protein